MERDWVDFWNLAFNGLGVVVAGGAFAFAIISFTISQRAAKAAADAQAKAAAAKAADDETVRFVKRTAALMAQSDTAHASGVDRRLIGDTDSFAQVVADIEKSRGRD